jgi:hypothetical protein
METGADEIGILKIP